jgi:hypothetical protein
LCYHRFSYRGLSPHKFTPVPGVHHAVERDVKDPPLTAALVKVIQVHYFMNCPDVLNKITDHYLSSRDYNGLSLRRLQNSSDDKPLKECLSDLLLKESISLVYGDYHPNPHIKALPSESVEEQIKKMHSPLFQNACAYPAANHLKTIVDKNAFKAIPFELCLALGEPQLSHKAFDLSVLEFYRNDPRYHYDNDDIRGYISIKDEFFETNKIKKSDQILLSSYGFCFDEKLNVYVATFIIYLSRLSSEHQLIWASKLVDEKTELHPDYYRTAIIGDWPERLSLFTAVLMEMQTINKLSKAIGRAPFFVEDFGEERRPREFGYLVRPTLKEYNDFIHLLDKMISENINRTFFKNEVALESNEERSDGKIIVRTKGSIQLLKEWLNQSFKTNDQSEIDQMISTFREIRSLRQKPAHSIKENQFSQEYIHKQREIMQSLYHALKTFRLVLSLHPRAINIQIDKLLKEGLIWRM